jgi:hypothetical protein
MRCLPLLSLLFTLLLKCQAESGSQQHRRLHRRHWPSSVNVAEQQAAAPTCNAISELVSSAEDLKAKERAVSGQCPNEASHLLRRQAGSVTDDYSCGPSNPCKNGACCAKSGKLKTSYSTTLTSVQDLEWDGSASSSTMSEGCDRNW